MKPDCRQVLSQIASYSVEELSVEDIDAFTRHLDDCPPCKGHWVLFEKTLTTLSQVGETEVSVHQSQQMWLTCLEHAQKKHQLPESSVQSAMPHSEAHHVEPSDSETLHGEMSHGDTLHNAGESSHKVEVLPQPFRSDSSQREGERRSSRISSPRSGLLGSSSTRTVRSGWLQKVNRAFTPRLSLALVGIAAAILGAAIFASPRPVSSQSSPAVPSQNRLVAAPADDFGTLPAVPELSDKFQVPPHATTGLIDYHAEMGFEPFSNHVAPTLVSHSATRQ